MASSLISQLAVMIKTEMRDSPLFPFDDGKDEFGRPNNRDYGKPHMKTLALNNNPIIVVSPEIQYFHLGNESAERRTPHYHILEDSKTIRNPNQGSGETRGSQSRVAKKGKRDYSVYLPPSRSDNSLTQEYRQSFKSGRRSYGSAQRRNVNRRYETRNERRPFRYNIHYAYIERILESILPGIASSLDLHLVSPRGLQQQLLTSVVDTSSSTMPFDIFTGEIIGG
jgi:hypothetical protein